MICRADNDVSFGRYAIKSGWRWTLIRSKNLLLIEGLFSFVPCFYATTGLYFLDWNLADPCASHEAFIEDDQVWRLQFIRTPREARH